MVLILIALASSYGMHAMEDPSTSPQKNFLGIALPENKKQPLLSTKALQESQTMQSWLEVLESGMATHPKITSPRREFTEQLIGMVGKSAVELINAYHAQENYSKWYTTLKLSDLLTLCSALHYIESPLHEAGAFIHALGKKVLEGGDTCNIGNTAPISVALAKTQKITLVPGMWTFKKETSYFTIATDQHHRHNEILTIARSRGYFYSARENRLVAIPLSENMGSQSLVVPEGVRITALYCGPHEKMFAGTDTGKIFDLTESSPKLIAQFATKKAVKKIYAQSPSHIIALADNSVIWKALGTEEKFFEKEYTIPIRDCAFIDYGTKISLLFSESEAAKVVNLTMYGHSISEQLFPVKYPRMSPDGKYLLGVLPSASTGGFLLKHVTVHDGTTETFFIEDPHAIDECVDRTNQAIIPWNGGMVGLPTIDLGFSDRGNFFYVAHGKGKMRIFNRYGGTINETIQNHSPVVYLHETDGELMAIRPTPINLIAKVYAAQAKSSDQKAYEASQPLSKLLLYAAIRFSYTTEGGLALSSRTQPTLYKEFLALSPEEQGYCADYFGVQATTS